MPIVVPTPPFVLPPLFDDVPEGFDADAIAAASAAVRAYCGWHIAPVITQDVVVDGPGSNMLSLRTLRLLDVVSCTVADFGWPHSWVLDDHTVVEDGVPFVVDTSSTSINVLNLQWSQNGYLYGPFFTKRLRGISLTITHGYESFPVELRALVLGLAQSGLVSSGVKSETRGPFSRTMYDSASYGSIGIGSSDAARLAPYLLPPLS